MGKKKKEELPDYTVADMDLEGMPWNTKKSWQTFSGPDKNRQEPDGSTASSRNPQPPLSREERRGVIWMALKAALLIAAVFGLAGFLFILFCVFVWLR